ncbi:sterol desaturase family protein [Algoriphagus hitonicola]|uniref:Sterol desaturase/sphingolipid hydroxylase, fatty acid hydroxylase superfamily n=1 Tax=Algoriphagus hitonicola TaxID=435880 RepID=A0A1I2XF62_9BACT|nr:sterol desaturase family protein [Algoriphagus hitonicola]SFH12113.1 Sterol desaturase/sphingolipid hydroxylase, fatty acid hydroxylase superfamily [Algoriphagus hitonicola]
MEKYFKIIIDGYYGYWDYLTSEILYPSWHNYFYWLIGLSVFVFALEVIVPWRKSQPIFRKDFWLDVFYMFFNFFLFSLILYNALSNVFVELFNDFLGIFGITNLVALEINSWPIWGQFLLMLVLADFIQWNVHRMLHRVPWLWEFHKVHHSVEQMGFAAHLRYHWMETIVYKSVQYLPLAMIGFGLDDFFILHIFTIAIGHLNHANLKITYGPFKYILNNPIMHTWHHVKHLPSDRPHGVNYGITLSLWDYLFGTAYIPHDGENEALGFDKVEEFPQTFWSQITYPWLKKKA